MRLADIFRRTLGGAPAPAPAPAVGTTPRVRLGANAPYYVYYARAPGAISQLAGGTGFELPSEPATQVAVDSNGWPAADFRTGPFIGPPQDAPYAITVSFDGQAVVAIYIANGFLSNLSAVSYNATTNRSTVTALWTPNANTYPGLLSFTSTKRTQASAVGTGVTNIDWRATSEINNTNIWSQALKTYLSDFKTLRTMDLQSTNNDVWTTTWASRPSALPNRMLSPEWCVAMGREFGSDLWMQIPTNATADWDNNFFAYVLANLPSNLNLNFGFSNETWNFGFGNSHLLVRIAAAEVGGAIGTETGRRLVSATRAAGVITLVVDYAMDLVVGQTVEMNGNATGIAPAGEYVITAVTANSVSFANAGADQAATSPNSGVWFSCKEKRLASSLVLGDTTNTNVYGLGGNWNVRRLLQAAERCRVIVGDAAMLTRFRPIIEGQGVDYYAGEGQLSYAAAYLASIGVSWATQKHVYGIAGAPYFQLGDSATGLFCDSGDVCPAHTQADYMAGWLSRMQTARDQYRFQKRAAVATKYGVKSMWYEGGADNAWNPGSANNALILASKLSQPFGDAHLAVLRDLGQSGSDLYMHYNASLGIAGWGYTNDVSVVTPFWQSFRDYIAQTPPAALNIVGPTGPTTIDGRAFVGQWDLLAPYPNQFNAQSVDWLVFSASAQTKSLVISYAAAVSGASATVKVNNVLAGATFSLSNVPADITTPRDGPILSVSLRPGYNVVNVSPTPGAYQGANDARIFALKFS